MKKDIMVSVLCPTYNHEAFIGDAIEGVLSQKTEFKYELIIHEDASTDRTAEIVKEYVPSRGKVSSKTFSPVLMSDLTALCIHME